MGQCLKYCWAEQDSDTTIIHDRFLPVPKKIGWIRWQDYFTWQILVIDTTNGERSEEEDDRIKDYGQDVFSSVEEENDNGCYSSDDDSKTIIVFENLQRAPYSGT